MFLVKNIYFRTLMSFILVAGAVFLVRDYLTFKNAEDSFIKNRLLQATDVVAYSISQSEPSGEITANSIEEVAQKLVRHSPDFRFLVLDSNVKPVAQPDKVIGQKHTNIPYSQLMLSGDTFTSILPPNNANPFRTLVYVRPVFLPSGDAIGIIQAEVRLDEADERLAELRARLVIGSLIGLILSSVFIFFFLKLSLKPLSRFTSAADAISKGDLTVRIQDHYSRDEVQRLTYSFNKMVVRLDAALKDEQNTREELKRFLEDSAHEFRTPLTVIRGYSDILKTVVDDFQKRRAINSIQSEVARLTRLVNDLLNLARARGNLGLIMKKLDVNTLVQSAISQMQVISKDVEISFETSENTFVLADEDKLKEVVLNLLDNALKNIENKGKVSVFVEKNGQKCQIRVFNTGHPIPEVALPNIFDRYWTSSHTSRSRSGTGLGLAIVKAIVEAHGGTVEARSSAKEGTTFTVLIPLVSE